MGVFGPTYAPSVLKLRLITTLAVQPYNHAERYPYAQTNTERSYYQQNLS